MMRALLAVSWQNLKRDYVALGLTFVLPVVFFSIFAVIFGGMGESAGGATEGVAVVVVDLDGSEASGRLLAALREEPALRVFPGSPSVEEARAIVRKGEAPAAAIIPEGFGESSGRFPGGDDGSGAIEVLYDEANPVARQIVAGMIQKVAMSESPDRMMDRGIEMLESFGGALTEEQRAAVERARALMRGRGAGADVTEAFAAPVRIRMTNVRASESDSGGEGSMTAYYAAGIGVMFLLFSMAGAAGSLLEEEENSTLERLLANRVTMGKLLVSRWLFFGIVGLLQVVLMFVWGAVVFGLDLWTASHLAGFAVMAALTAAAAAAFGIGLATLCTTRAQLGAISTIVILIMSALGGSMVPRFVMPAFMDTTALFTFNGWALDGFLKVFWFDDPAAGVGATLASIVPQAIALVLMTILFLGLARLFARRWETA